MFRSSAETQYYSNGKYSKPNSLKNQRHSFLYHKKVSSMKKLLTILLLTSIIFISCQKEIKNSDSPPDSALVNRNEAAKPEAAVKVFTTGLNNPRELKFGPDGYLYVAEG